MANFKDVNETKVYVIINYDKYTLEEVILDIKEEGYKHLFYFAKPLPSLIRLEYLEASDEIWCFGDCTDISDYKMAVEEGKEIWIMG